MRGRPGSFTDEEDAYILEHYGSVRARLIAAKLGRTTNSIIGRANRLHTEPVPPSEKRKRASQTYREKIAEDPLAYAYSRPKPIAKPAPIYPPEKHAADRLLAAAEDAERRRNAMRRQP